MSFHVKKIFHVKQFHVNEVRLYCIILYVYIYIYIYIYIY